MNLAENLCLLGSGFGLCLRFGLLLGFELGLDLLRVFVDVFLSAHLLDLTGHAVGKRTQIIVGNLVGGFLLDFNRLAVITLDLPLFGMTCPGFCSSREPMMAAGIMGQPVSNARRAAPVCPL